jgi:hypothetical protein
VNQIEIRYFILEDLYNQAVLKGRLDVNLSDEILEKFEINNVAKNSILFNLLYLEDRGLIDINWGAQRTIFGITLTSNGCDIVEFYKLGSETDSPEKETKFKDFMSRIVSSGINVLEGSAVGLVNLVLSKLLS